MGSIRGLEGQSEAKAGEKERRNCEHLGLERK